jgi:high-affinity K+ transport system ATPase subunit B
MISHETKPEDKMNYIKKSKRRTIGFAMMGDGTNRCAKLWLKQMLSYHE